MDSVECQFQKKKYISIYANVYVVAILVLCVSFFLLLLNIPKGAWIENTMHTETRVISSIFLLVVNLEIDSITAKPYIPQKS